MTDGVTFVMERDLKLALRELVRRQGAAAKAAPPAVIPASAGGTGSTRLPQPLP